MSDEHEKNRSAFGNVLYRDYLEQEGKKKITQRRLSELSGVAETDISRMVSRNSKFAKGQTLYDDIYALFMALATPEMVGDISVEKAESLIQKILDELKDEKQRERFVVISGTVGVGKSELAYQVAEEVKRLRLFPSVKIIYLENKTSLEGALKDIHKELQQLPPNTLLVLDNCEHLKGLTGELSKLRKEHRQLTILATSSVEMTGSDHRIEPLETNDATQLFLEAAKKVGKNFTPN